MQTQTTSNYPTDTGRKSADHTPGPWRIVGVRPGYGVDVETCDSEPITVNGADDDAVNYANARLIAAAPALLAALHVVAKCVADDLGGVTLGSFEQGIVRAAIAQATGGAP